MKKLFVLLLALTMVGVAVWADDAPAAPAPVGQFHISNYGQLFGYIKTGDGVASTGWGPDWDGNKGIDQGWSFGYDGKDFGFSAVTEFGMGGFGIPYAGTSGDTLVTFDAYYTIANLVKFDFGKLDMSQYRWTTLVEGEGQARFGGRDYAGMLTVMPVDGLAISVLENVPGNNTPGQGGLLPATNVNFGVESPQNYAGLTSAAATYTAKDMGKIYFAFNDLKREVSGGVQYTGMKNLVAQAVVAYDFGSLYGWTSSASSLTPKDNTTWVMLSGTYTMDALSLGLDACLGDGPDNTAAAANLIAYAAELKVEYALGSYAVGALLGYDDGKGNGLFVGQASPWDGVEIYPYVKKNFDNGNYVQVGVVYASGADKNGAVLNDGSWVLMGTHGQSVIAIPITYNLAF